MAYRIDKNEHIPISSPISVGQRRQIPRYGRRQGRGCPRRPHRPSRGPGCCTTTHHQNHRPNNATLHDRIETLSHALNAAIRMSSSRNDVWKSRQSTQSSNVRCRIRTPDRHLLRYTLPLVSRYRNRKLSREREEKMTICVYACERYDSAIRSLRNEWTGEAAGASVRKLSPDKNGGGEISITLSFIVAYYIDEKYYVLRRKTARRRVERSARAGARSTLRAARIDATWARKSHCTLRERFDPSLTAK